MRCSGCYKVSLVVPFCSIEHQKMVSADSEVGAGDGGIVHWRLRGLTEVDMELTYELVLSA